MQSHEIIHLLKKKPGYEMVYMLLRGPQRRQDLADHIDEDGGTLDRWLNEASDKGLVTVNVDLRTNPETQVEEKYVEVTLNHHIPDNLIAAVESRGSEGFRTTIDGFADSGVLHHWDDPHSL